MLTFSHVKVHLQSKHFNASVWTNVRFPRPCGDSEVVVGGYDLGSEDDTSSADPRASTTAILERRLHKAITANAKWQEKYEIETKVSCRELYGGIFCTLAYTAEVYGVSVRYSFLV